MKRFMFVIVGVAAMLSMTGCPSKELIDAPEIVKVLMDTASVSVTWKTDTALTGNADFSGYNVFAYTDSSALLVEDGEDLNKSNVNVITDTFFTIEGLAQDSVYYIQVRTVNTDDKVGSYNTGKPFVKASPRPEFTATINFEWNTPGIDLNCAIKLADATLMADSAMASGGADLFVDCFPITKDTVAFDSPSHSSEWGSGCRITKLLNLGQYELDDIYEVTTEPTDTTYEPVDVGDLVIIKTADNNYAKIHVDAIDKVNDEVTITYAYQDNPDCPFFSRPK